MSVQTGHEAYCFFGRTREKFEIERPVFPHAVALCDTLYFTQSAGGGPVTSVSHKRGALVSAEGK